jgi:hypothetical protein
VRGVRDDRAATSGSLPQPFCKVGLRMKYFRPSCIDSFASVQ